MTERRLAAILVADVVGYSKRVGSDEVGTLADLSKLKHEIIEPTIGKHAGRLFKSVGDGFLIEFSSAVQAVLCARAIHEANAQGALPLRIGIHVGDVVVQGDDLMGDGVNIAARIESVADAGGIAISRAVHEQVRDKLDIRFTDKGEVALKNLARPVHVFAIDGLHHATAIASAPPLPLPDKPSIAVLPFQNMSGDPEQDYFADGMVEDIITALSRTKSLFVIARNSSFTYKGKAVDIKQVGRELGVRYVLEGSVRKAGNRLRVTGQLIDATTGSHIWADRFEGGVEDLFDLQDQVTSRVTGAIAPEVEQAEIERARRKPTHDLQAYDYYLRGLASLYAQSKEATDEALALFHKAAHLDAGFALPLAQASLCYVQRKAYGWTVDRDQEMAEAEKLARCALELNRKDPRVLVTAGYTLAYVCGCLEEGADLLDQGIGLDPNYAISWTWRAATKMWLGAKESVIEDYERTLRLNPLDPLAFIAQNGLARAHFLAGRYDEALAWAEKSLHLRPHHLPTLQTYMASLALAGRAAEARKAYEVYHQHDPTARILNIREWTPLRSDEDMERLAAGLRLAGMPE
jgi:TolB-like protein/class 3 adenylate cyclase